MTLQSWFNNLLIDRRDRVGFWNVKQTSLLLGKKTVGERDQEVGSFMNRGEKPLRKVLRPPQGSQGAFLSKLSLQDQ